MVKSASDSFLFRGLWFPLSEIKETHFQEVQLSYVITLCHPAVVTSSLEVNADWTHFHLKTKKARLAGVSGGFFSGERHVFVCVCVCVCVCATTKHSHLRVLHFSVYSHWNTAATLLQMTVRLKNADVHIHTICKWVKRMCAFCGVCVCVCVCVVYQVPEESSLSYAAQHSLRVMEDGHHLQDVCISGANLHC